MTALPSIGADLDRFMMIKDRAAFDVVIEALLEGGHDFGVHDLGGGWQVFVTPVGEEAAVAAYFSSGLAN